MQASLDPEPGRPPVAGGEPFVDLPVRHVVVDAPQLTEDLGVEVGVVGQVAGPATEHGDLGVGEQVGDEAAVDRGGDRPAGVADDDDLGGVGIVLGEIVERGGAVDEAVVLDGQLRRILAGDVTEIDVPGARRHVDERVVGEGVVVPGEVQDPAPREPRILARDAPVVEVRLAVRCR